MIGFNLMRKAVNRKGTLQIDQGQVQTGLKKTEMGKIKLPNYFLVDNIAIIVHVV